MSRKFVLVNDQVDNGMYCVGVFDSYYETLGYALEKIYEFHDSYKEDGDMFDYTEPYELEGECGYRITVEFKSRNWDEAGHESWNILFLEDGDKGNE